MKKHLFPRTLLRRVLGFSVVLLTAVCLAACGSDPKKETPAASGLSIVTTIFPEYDWVRNILGDAGDTAEVTLLLDNSVDLHSYQPTADDIMKLSACDLFVYVGGESDSWVADALKEATNRDMIVINLLDALGDRAKEEELVEGMETEEEEAEEAEEEVPEYDEHVWLSLKNASYLVNVLSEALQSLDPDHAERYRTNTAVYLDKLNALDTAYQSAVAESEVRTLLFADRFPFRYLVDDYGLSYYAAFSGCSAETEASFETIAFLSRKVDELSLDSVLTIEGRTHRIAETIIQNTRTRDQRILTMDSMQSATLEDLQNGRTYLSIMEDNLQVLREALNLKDTAPAEKVGAADDTSPGSAEEIQVDLTVMSKTMVYSEVYNMMYEPDRYIGKTVKMTGLFAAYHDEDTGNDYYACVIQDALACCAQGLEFIPAEDASHPEASMEEGDLITVVGIFDTYVEDGDTYYALRDARPVV